MLHGVAAVTNMRVQEYRPSNEEDVRQRGILRWPGARTREMSWTDQQRCIFAKKVSTEVDRSMPNDQFAIIGGVGCNSSLITDDSHDHGHEGMESINSWQNKVERSVGEQAKLLQNRALTGRG